jgi:hypothetical protein
MRALESLVTELGSCDRLRIDAERPIEIIRARTHLLQFECGSAEELCGGLERAVPCGTRRLALQGVPHVSSETDLAEGASGVLDALASPGVEAEPVGQSQDPPHGRQRTLVRSRRPR